MSRPRLLESALRVWAIGGELMIELPPGHRVDTNAYVLNVNEALELGHQLIMAAAEILADRSRDG